MTRHHFMRGAQKKTVLGPRWADSGGVESIHRPASEVENLPAGWFMNDENLEVAAVDAAPDIVLFEETGTRGGGVLKSV